MKIDMKMKSILSKMFLCMHFVIVSAFLVSCVSSSSYQSRHPNVLQGSLQAVENSQQAGFTEENIKTETFTLYALLSNNIHSHSNILDNKNKVLHVYIEGDGLAWETRTKISSDPTPSIATALHIAENDPMKSKVAILYLARPCQYNKEENIPLCNNKYWTSHRLAPEIVEAMSEAITQIKEKVGAQKIVLIGYSGGGALASLIANKRDDVSFLGTIAANLDIDYWTTFHNVSPMHGSLNPIDFTTKIKNLPQRHISSFADTVIPPEISQAFCNKINSPQACVTVDNIPHWGDWEKVWNYNYYLP